MTPQPKSRTIGTWLVLDNEGSAWLVQCLACQRKTAFPRSLLSGPYPPRCKCGGKSVTTAILAPAKPTEAPKPADNPVDKIASPPVADALFKVFGMVPVKADKPEPATHPKYGKLQVIEPAKGKTKGRHVLCRCDCGTERVFALRLLIGGLTTSCGCGKLERIRKLIDAARVTAMPGQRYGKLVVVRDIAPYIAPRGKSYRRVLCLCDCGRDRMATVLKLNAGDITCCYTCSPHAKRWTKWASLQSQPTVAQEAP